MSVSLSEFVAQGVPCLAPIFLGEMLTKHPAPSVEDALIADYRNLLRQQNKHSWTKLPVLYVLNVLNLYCI